MNKYILTFGGMTVAFILSACGKNTIDCSSEVAFDKSKDIVLGELKEINYPKFMIANVKLALENPTNKDFDNKICGMDASTLGSYYSNPIKNKINEVTKQLGDAYEQEAEKLNKIFDDK
ncbi:MAG: hypothetical protein ACI4V7_03635 [Succinivibrionaceae bacterium]